MDALTKYLKLIDESSYDCRDMHKINSEFQQVIQQLMEVDNPEIAKIADLDRQVFSVSKSFNHKLDSKKGTIYGLSWKMSGTHPLEDGSVIPLHWPDVEKYTLSDFEYFEKRYKECKNLYAKTEYGLMVYFGAMTPFSKHHDFKKQLCEELFLLSKKYLEKNVAEGERNHHVLDFYHTLRLAFGIAEKSKIEPELTDLTNYVFDVHQTWDITRDGTLRVLLDLSGLMSEYFSLFKGRVNFEAVLEKNLLGAKELEKTYTWGAMYAVNRNIEICQKLNKSSYNLLAYKAQLYEKLSLDAESRANLACISFIEESLRLYQLLKDEENVKRLESRYGELRGKFELSKFYNEIPKEKVEKMYDNVKEVVKKCNEFDIIHHFIASFWYDSLENIEALSIEISKKEVLQSIIPVIIIDKFGNTIDTFNSPEEKKRIQFWNAYSMNFQLGTQTMHVFFIEALKSGKLSLTTVMNYLEGTWLNEDIFRNYNGVQATIRPLETLSSGLKKMFEELDKYLIDNEYPCDFVAVIDSLTLKIEGLLRNLCEKLGIATFKTRAKGADKLVMEKLIDDLLVDLAHQPKDRPEQITNFDEKDRVLIKYVMSEKAGLNLRNQVAHGLMDLSEYSFDKALLLFCIVIKLSKYIFTKIPLENDTIK